MTRKHISLKTKLAATVLELQRLRYSLAFVRGTPAPMYIPYNDAVAMTADQLLSLFEWHHNKYYSFEGGDHFSNLEPLPIKEHRRQTKIDAKVIAKSNRIRAKLPNKTMTTALDELDRGRGRKLQSRGFDRRYRRKMDGTVVKR